MRGIGFDFDQPYYDLGDVVLTNSRFSCTYAEKGYTYRIEATSKDGVIYLGNWGHPGLVDAYTVELKRFESKDSEIVLMGQWSNAHDNQVGVWLFRLSA